MDPLSLLPGLQVPGRIGLVLGFYLKKPVVCGFAEIPKVSMALPESLADILNLKLQEGFSMKDWLIQHAIQGSKLLVPCIQIIGLYTTSNEQIIESKQNGISNEVSELIKRLNKVVKSKILIHYHLDLASKKAVSRMFDFEASKNLILAKTEEKKVSFIEISAKVKLWLDFSKEEVDDFSGILKECSKFFEESVIRFRVLDKGVLCQSQTALVYSKSSGKVLRDPVFRFRGILDSRIVIPSETHPDIAGSLIRKDLLQSLENRYSLVKNNLKGLEENFALPRRIFFRGDILNSDYLLENETVDEGKERTKMLLGLTPTSSEEFETFTQVKANQVGSSDQGPKKNLILAFIALAVLLLGFFLAY